MNLEVDLGMLSDESEAFMVNNLAEFFGRISNSHALELELAITQLLIMTNIVIPDFNIKNHIVEARQAVERKCFAIDWIQVILLYGGFKFAIRLVRSKLFLFEFKLEVRIALA